MAGIMIQILRITVLAGLLAASQLAAESAGDNEIRKAEEAWAAAVKAGDRATLEKMFSDDLVYTHSTGSVDTKPQYLDKLKAGTQRYTDLQYSGMKVRSWGGDAGVINSQLRMIGSTNGTPFDNTVYVIHVWMKQGGSWKLVAHQTTRKGQ